MPAGAVRGRGQVTDRQVEVLFTEELPDLVVLDETGQSVGAEHDPVAQLDVHEFQVRAGGVLSVEHLDDERPVRVGGCLLGGQASLVDQLLHPGVVMCELVQFAAAQQVAAGVADVGQSKLRAVEHGAAERGPHAVEGQVSGHEFGQPGVGPLQEVRHVRQHRLAGGVLVRVACHGDGDGGGEVTGSSAAHAVGDHQHGGRGIPGVLVVLADTPHLGVRLETQRVGHAHDSSRMSVLPMRITSPSETGTGEVRRWPFT